MYMKNIITLFFACVGCVNMFSQNEVISNSNLSTDINQVITKILLENKGRQYLKFNPSDFLGYEASKIIQEIENFNSLDINGQFILQTLAFDAGLRTDNNDLRQKSVKIIFANCFNREPLLWQQASKRLLYFNAEDFSVETKKRIVELLQIAPLKREHILLTGQAEVQEAEDILKEIVIEYRELEKNRSVGKWYGEKNWYASLALARLGDQESTDYVINKIEQERDDIARVGKLLRDLSYTRQEKAVLKLKEYLYSNRVLPGAVDVPTTAYSQYALDQLTAILENIPIEHKGFPGYTYEEITQAREWMNEQTDFVIKR